MRVYRVITAREITNLYRGELKREATVKGANTHNYQAGVDYIHFFRYQESAQYYQDVDFCNLSSEDKRIAFMVANIPNEILKEHMGYGYYNGVDKMFEWEPIPLPEYAIPNELFKPEYIVEVNAYISSKYQRSDPTEYSRYLWLVKELLEKYDNHYTVGRKLSNLDLAELLGVTDENRTEDEIFSDKIKEFRKIRDDLFS